MAGETIAKQSGGLDLSDIMSALNTGADIFAGKSSKTTTGQKFSQEQMNSMLQSILEQTGGYADVGQQVHAAGGYNSSTQGLMLNDLLTRSAKRVAELNTEQVTQTEVDPKIGQQGIQDTLGALAGAQLASSIFGGIGDLVGIGTVGKGAVNAGKSIAGEFGFGNDAFSGSSEVLLDTTSGIGSTANASGVTPYNLSEGLGATAEGGGFMSSVSDFATGNNVYGQGAGYAMAAYNAYNDIKDDNWGGAVGSGVGAFFGGPLGAAAGQAIGTLADEYILDPINNKIIKPVGHAFDEAITQNVGKAVKSVGKGIGSAVKKIGKVFCFLTGTKILMANGTYKEISTLTLGDVVAIGGKVLAIGSALCDEIWSYKGELCSGSHVVLEDGKWIRVRDSVLSTGPHGLQDYVVHPITTENHVLVTANGFISSDYAGLDDADKYTEAEKLEILNADAYNIEDLQELLEDLFPATTVQE